MTHNWPFYILDVFAETRYAGNQLAVFRAAPPDAEMQQISREMNFSETTFVTSDQPRDGGYDVRIFTPSSELPFAGHPTLGTAYVIQHEIVGESAAQVTLNLKVGQIPVRFGDDGVLWMQQKPPQFGHTYSPHAVADMLGLKRADIDDRFPAQEVSTGLPFIIAPLKTLDAVKRAKVGVEKFQGMIEGVRGLRANAILVFCPETYHQANHLNTRVFLPLLGIPEDPAAGSANGCLAGYLSRHRYFGVDTVDVRVEQGYEIGRPSLLMARAAQSGDHIDVQVGGRVVMLARGEWTE